jgi:ABC-2 type transport system ATP-binding protein
VEIRLVGPAPDLAAVPGVGDLVVDGDRLSCTLGGDPRAFLAAIASAAVADVTIETPRLEDAFLELYEGDAASATAGR